MAVQEPPEKGPESDSVTTMLCEVAGVGWIETALCSAQTGPQVSQTTKDKAMPGGEPL